MGPDMFEIPKISTLYKRLFQFNDYNALLRIKPVHISSPVDCRCTVTARTVQNNRSQFTKDFQQHYKPKFIAHITQIEINDIINMMVFNNV